MTTLEKKIKAKIPGEDTGIKVCKTMCDICSPDNHCGIDAYVKDGELIKVEGSVEHPYSHGYLCTKGQSNRSYVYRKDRVRTPMKRVGPKGTDELVPISWDEAYTIIAEKLNGYKEAYGPHSVAFFAGHAKWFRPIMQRFTYDFGSVNFGTDCSVCNTSLIIARVASAGCNYMPDIDHTNTFLGWAFGGYYSLYHDVQAVMRLKERGGKVIIVDPRVTPAVKNLADIHLQIKPGTDGVLAHGMAKLILDNGWEDKAFIEKYTFGFGEYRDYVRQFDLEKVSKITGVPANLIYEAAKLYATNGPACINEGCLNIAHHINGQQNYRAITALNFITGNFDRAGGCLPAGETYNMRSAGFVTREGAFSTANKPDYPRIGEGQFPLWDLIMTEYQGTVMAEQILTGKPYEIKAMFGFGFNTRMMPDTDKTIRALEKLDFFVNADLFMTDAMKYADIVLPVCSAFERSEFKVYPGGYAMMTKPVIAPLYESKSDVDVMLELMPYLGLHDELLEKGYDACIDWIIDGCGVTAADLKAADGCVKVPAAREYVPGSFLAGSIGTPTGKIEFHSNLVGMFEKSHGLNPIATIRGSFDDDASPDYAVQYPYYLTTGARIGNSIHSRLHEVPFARSIRPEPQVDISIEDAAELHVKTGDVVELSSPTGSIRVKAYVSGKLQKNNIHLVHGYREADSSKLIAADHLDPYSGFPAYKHVRCNIRKVEE